MCSHGAPPGGHLLLPYFSYCAFLIVELYLIAPEIVKRDTTLLLEYNGRTPITLYKQREANAPLKCRVD